MGLFNFFKKKEQLLEPLDFKIFGTDVHSHFIPGIDDGAKTIDDSIALIQGIIELGYTKIITTPHIMCDYYKNTPEIIKSGAKDVQNALKDRGIKIDFSAAAEYNLDAEFEDKIEAEELLTFGKNYVLFELPFFAEPQNLSTAVFKMQTKDYQPILAHVERYSYWFNDRSKITSLKDKGVLLQLNINSLTGHYGPEVKELAEWMIDENLVDVVGSDCHHLGHIDLLKKAAQLPYLHKLAERDLLNKSI